MDNKKIDIIDPENKLPCHIQATDKEVLCGDFHEMDLPICADCSIPFCREGDHHPELGIYTPHPVP